MTETGLHLGWLRSIQGDLCTHKLEAIVVSPSSIDWLPDTLVGAYEMTNVELICQGHDRLVIADGSEATLTPVTIGVLERLGWIRLPWLTEENTIVIRASGDDDHLGPQPVTSPRNPSPNPTDAAIALPAASDKNRLDGDRTG